MAGTTRYSEKSRVLADLDQKKTNTALGSNFLLRFAISSISASRGRPSVRFAANLIQTEC